MHLFKVTYGNDYNQSILPPFLLQVALVLPPHAFLITIQIIGAPNHFCIKASYEQSHHLMIRRPHEKI